MRRFFRRLKARLGPVLQSDTAFIEAAYREILGRNADQDGLTHYRAVLHDSLGRTAVLLSLMRSEEFTGKLTAQMPPLASLRALRPERYRETVDRMNGEPIAVFDVESRSDFDWFEAAVLEHAYYQKPGVWNLRIDVDTRVLAEVVASFAPDKRWSWVARQVRSWSACGSAE